MLTGIRWRTGRSRCSGEAWSRSWLGHTVTVKEYSTRNIVRVSDCLGEVKHWGKTNVGSLQKLTPFIAGFTAEYVSKDCLALPPAAAVPLRISGELRSAIKLKSLK